MTCKSCGNVSFIGKGIGIRYIHTMVGAGFFLLPADVAHLSDWADANLLIGTGTEVAQL